MKCPYCQREATPVGDWKERRTAGEAAWEEWYQTKFAEIIRVVESEESRRFAGEIETLAEHLKPIRSDARVYDLLKEGFLGRAWLFDAAENWRLGVLLSRFATNRTSNKQPSRRLH